MYKLLDTYVFIKTLYTDEFTQFYVSCLSNITTLELNK